MKGISISLTVSTKTGGKDQSQTERDVEKQEENRQFHFTCRTHVERLTEQEEYGAQL